MLVPSNQPVGMESTLERVDGSDGDGKYLPSMHRDDVIRDLRERYQQSGRLLNERERRQWAATEALRLGRGGLTVVSLALRISPNTIKRGMREISVGQTDPTSPANARLRKPGGGRKPKNSAAD